MLTKQTVFVLGAGASSPFRFPTGIELARLVVEGLRLGQARRTDFLSMTKFDEAEVETFRAAFYNSGKNSVDAFLEHRPDFMRIGKAATALFLIPFESRDQLFGYADNWLRYLYDRLNAPFDRFGENRLSIVTFNYDRLVEEFLFTALQNTYDRGGHETRTVLAKIPIVHLHGRLGFLPWEHDVGPQEDAADHQRSFGGELSSQTLSAAVRYLKIIHEDTADRDADFKLARQLLAEAEQIIFLGFGFNQTNVERLGLAALRPGRSTATCFGFSGREVDSVRLMCAQTIDFIDPNRDCLHALRNYVDWS